MGVSGLQYVCQFLIQVNTYKFKILFWYGNEYCMWYFATEVYISNQFDIDI